MNNMVHFYLEKGNYTLNAQESILTNPCNFIIVQPLLCKTPYSINFHEFQDICIKIIDIFDC